MGSSSDRKEAEGDVDFHPGGGGTFADEVHEHSSKEDGCTSTSTTRTPQGRIRLLLHTINGCVPYLNPAQVEKHFPPSEDFWIGLAVRDTCVVPVFDKPSAQRKQEEGKRGDDAGNVAAEEDASRNRNDNKTRGYTFAPVRPDRWLLPYTRVTVPTFDLLDDDRRYNKKKPKDREGSASTSNSAGGNHVLVWTPHGRQKLTSDLYSTAALDGLQSQHTVSLYDMSTDADEKKAGRTRVRNQQWCQELAQRIDEGDHSTSAAGPVSGGRTCLWVPVLLSTDEGDLSANGNSSADSKSLDSSQLDIGAVSGVAFVGSWQPGFSADVRNISATWKAILSTHSLSQILEIATEGSFNVIGTGLPSTWAKRKLALGIDFSRISDDGNMNSERTSKRRRVEDHDALTERLDADGCMDLTSEAFARDARGLVGGCTCMACHGGRFSRAYIHHLVRSKELLAEILIFGHNLHSLIRLIRAFNATGNRAHVRHLIEQQLDSAATDSTIT
jgi:Queuine tRNA-ribosyltransferase